jgi:hypothetical protein
LQSPLFNWIELPSWGIRWTVDSDNIFPFADESFQGLFGKSRLPDQNDPHGFPLFFIVLLVLAYLSNEYFQRLTQLSAQL